MTHLIYAALKYSYIILAILTCISTYCFRIVCSTDFVMQ